MPEGRWMTAQKRGILVKGSEVFVAQPSECPQRHVDGARRVPLRQNEKIGRLQDLVIENQQQVEA